MRDKLIELIDNNKACPFDDLACCECEYSDITPCFAGRMADVLIANGVTLQTTPISYERLLKLVSKMHCWIFLYSFDEQEVYDELGLTEEENYILGYGGSFEVLPEPPKESE